MDVGLVLIANSILTGFFNINLVRYSRGAFNLEGLAGSCMSTLADLTQRL